MGTNRESAPARTSKRQSPQIGTRFADAGILLWILASTFLWWLLYGPGMTFISARFGFLSFLAEWRTSLLPFFTFQSWL
jgi:hypothetical protein